MVVLLAPASLWAHEEEVEPEAPRYGWSGKGEFGRKLAYQVRNNSDVPVGVDKIDTQTSANLVYSF
jgi:hypothetical protein